MLMPTVCWLQCGNASAALSVDFIGNNEVDLVVQPDWDPQLHTARLFRDGVQIGSGFPAAGPTEVLDAGLVRGQTYLYELRLLNRTNINEVVGRFSRNVQTGRVGGRLKRNLVLEGTVDLGSDQAGNLTVLSNAVLTFAPGAVINVMRYDQIIVAEGRMIADGVVFLSNSNQMKLNLTGEVRIRNSLFTNLVSASLVVKEFQNNRAHLPLALSVTNVTGELSFTGNDIPLASVRLEASDGAKLIVSSNQLISLSVAWPSNPPGPWIGSRCAPG